MGKKEFNLKKNSSVRYKKLYYIPFIIFYYYYYFLNFFWGQNRLLKTDARINPEFDTESGFID